MINIITDSTADLGPKLAAQYGIRVVPMYVYIHEQTYRDGMDININELYRSVSETGQIPKTSAPTVADFEKAFSQPGDIVFISLSSRLSVTYQNALLAKETLPEKTIYIIDSRNLSTGIGLLVFKAVAMRDAGCSAGEIASQIEAMVPKVRTSFVPETLEYIYKGGRCTAIEAIMGSLLHIRPVLSVNPDGTLGIKAKTRGTRMKALQVLLDDFAQNLPQIDIQRVFITHSGCLEDGEYLRNELMKIAPIEEIIITRAGCVISSHCGPGTIGILYMLK